MYTKKQIYQLMEDNRNRISDSIYPNEEIENILSENSRSTKEYKTYRGYALEWIDKSPLLIGYISN